MVYLFLKELRWEEECILHVPYQLSFKLEDFSAFDIHRWALSRPIYLLEWGISNVGLLIALQTLFSPKIDP